MEIVHLMSLVQALLMEHNKSTWFGITWRFFHDYLFPRCELLCLKVFDVDKDNVAWKPKRMYD